MNFNAFRNNKEKFNIDKLSKKDQKDYFPLKKQSQLSEHTRKNY